MATKNRERWVQWNRPPHENEIKVNAELLITKEPAQYSRFHDYAIIFDSARDLVDAIHNNVNDGHYVKGNGSWRKGEMGMNGNWSYGSDPEIQDLNQLDKFLLSGRASSRTMKAYDKELDRLRTQFPELQRLKEVGIANRRRRVWREEGDELDIDRYMNGDVEQWSSMRRASSVKRTCTIVYESGTSCGTEADSFAQSMATLAALVEIVESSGISTELVIAFTSNKRGDYEHHKTIAVKAKNCDERFDVNRLLSMSSSGMFRGHIFGIIENMCHNDTPSWSYGTAISIEEKRRAFGDLWGADIHVQGSDNFNNKDNIKFIINEVMKVIGTKPH